MRLHRKIWEFCFIAQALDERGMLARGRRGLGFAVGTEPLPAMFASRGCAIVATDLATAVVAGVIVSALAYAWQNAKRIHATTRMTPDGAKVYAIEGPLFFGSAEGFAALFDPVADPAEVIIDFAASRVADQSALAAIEALAARYDAEGKALSLRHLSHDCHRLLNRAGQLMVDSDDDPDYAIAVDYEVKSGVFGGAH